MLPGVCGLASRSVSSAAFGFVDSFTGASGQLLSSRPGWKVGAQGANGETYGNLMVSNNMLVAGPSSSASTNPEIFYFRTSIDNLTTQSIQCDYSFNYDGGGPAIGLGTYLSTSDVNDTGKITGFVLHVSPYYSTEGNDEDGYNRYPRITFDITKYVGSRNNQLSITGFSVYGAGQGNVDTIKFVTTVGTSYTDTRFNVYVNGFRAVADKTDTSGSGKLINSGARGIHLSSGTYTPQSSSRVHYQDNWLDNGYTA